MSECLKLLNDKQRKQLFVIILSNILGSSVSDIYQACLKKFRGLVGIHDLEEIIKILIQNPNSIIQEPIKFSKTYKFEDAFVQTVEERFMLLLSSRYSDDSQMKFARQQFSPYTSDSDVRSTLDSFRSIDKKVIHEIIVAFAEQIANEEFLSIEKEFTQEMLKSKNVSEIVFQWWRDTLKEPQVPNQSIDDIVVNTSKIQQLEIALSSFSSVNDKHLAVLVSESGEHYIHKRIYKIAHPKVAESSDIILSDQYSDYGALIMFKNDMCFYIENIGKNSIYVNTIEIPTGYSACLKSEFLIEIDEKSYIILINHTFISIIKKKMFV